MVNNPLRAAKLEGYVQLADLISRAADSLGEGPTKPPRTVDRENVSLELYATTGALHERLEDEMATRLRKVRTLKDMLMDRQQAQNAMVERLAERAGPAEDEARKLRVHRESLAERLREIESSATWRLFGAYRRLRPAVGALIRP